jgi:short-subunit dehydrogenase
MSLLLPIARRRQLSNKTVWITGASSGIGRALAFELARYQCRLVLSARNENTLLPVYEHCKQAGCTVEIICFDLAITSTINEAVTKFIALGWQLDILVNNGGVGQRGATLQTHNEVERLIMETNFWGQVLLSKQLLQHKLLNKFGNIVVVSSMAGLMGIQNRSAYCASKFALTGYFEALRPELYAQHINVLTVYPGRVNTQFSKNAFKDNGEKYNIVDKTTEKGIKTECVARKIVKAIIEKRKQLIIAKQERVLYFMKKWMFSLFCLTQRKI